MFRLLAPLVAVVAFVLPAAAEDEKFYRIRHVETGKFLAVADNSEEAGARAVLAKEDAASEFQQWKVVKDGEFLKIVNRKSGKVLDVFEESKDEGANIILWDEKSEGNDNQRWSWAGDGKAKRLKSKSSELVVCADDEGKLVQKKSDDKAKGQTWELVEVKK